MRIPKVHIFCGVTIKKNSINTLPEHAGYFLRLIFFPFFAQYKKNTGEGSYTGWWKSHKNG